MELKQLYREIVNEHNLHPVNKRTIENPDLVLRGVNPSCGDDITLSLNGGTVGVDGRTLSVQEGREFTDAFAAKDISMISSIDLVNEVWKDRPPMPLKPCFYLDEKWTGESTADKLARVRTRMDEYGAIVKKLAGKYGLTTVDLQAGWDELFQYMHSTNIAWDRVHPNQTGCMYIAKQFLKAVGADRC